MSDAIELLDRWVELHGNEIAGLRFNFDYCRWYSHEYIVPHNNALDIITMAKLRELIQYGRDRLLSVTLNTLGDSVALTYSGPYPEYRASTLEEAVLLVFEAIETEDKTNDS